MQGFLMYIGGDADYIPFFVASEYGPPDSGSGGRKAQQPGRALIDQGIMQVRPFRVIIRFDEIPARQQPYAIDIEIPGTYSHVPHGEKFGFGRLGSLNLKIPAQFIPCDPVGAGSAFYAADLFQLFGKAGLPGYKCGIPFGKFGRPDDQHLRDIHAEVLFIDEFYLLVDDSRSDDEHDGDGKLADHQGLAQPGALHRPDEFSFQHQDGLEGRKHERRIETGNKDAGYDERDQRSADAVAIEPFLEEIGQGEVMPDERIEPLLGEEHDPERDPERRDIDDQGFRQELPDQLSFGGPGYFPDAH